MCIVYAPTSREQLDLFSTTPLDGADWEADVYRDYAAPFIIAGANGRRQTLLGNYSMVPKRKIGGGKDFETLNAKAETIGELRSYKTAWHASQLCLIPLRHFYEPNWETDVHERWWIGMADRKPFAVAGIWRSWDEKDGSVMHSFTQITVAAEGHPLMSRFHRPGKPKRSLVIVAPDEYDDWLNCKDPERARSYLHLYPAELMAAGPNKPAPAVEV